MAEETVFRGVIEFLDKIGVYDVILPFLLVFTIVFAILEKTRVLGTEEIEGKKYPKKNIDAMVSFVISFLVVASTKLVSAINQALAQGVLILILIVMFLLLIGAFFKEGEDVILTGNWRTFFMVIIFAGIVLIFLNALGWLVPFWNFLVENWKMEWVASLIMIIIIILFIIFITHEKKPGKKEEKKE
jgi:hypothetical protein